MGPFIQKIYQRFIRIRGNPREIALGFALGLFIGFSPTMGVQIAIALFLAALLKWNKFTAVIGVHVTNPFTAPVIYGFTYIIGSRMMGLQKPLNLTFTFDWSTLVNMIDQAPRIFLALTIGGIVIGAPIAVIGYFACFAVVDRYQRTTKENLLRKTRMLKQKMIQRKARKSKTKPPRN